MPRFTRLQQRMMDVLKDGEAHPLEELWACLEDDLAPRKNIAVHIWHLRKLLKGTGYGIRAETFDQRRSYRYVRVLASIDE